MQLDLEGKTALVTGASRGLGFACAEALSAEGAAVAICARNVANVRAAARDIAARTGNPVAPIVADLADAGAFVRLAAEARAALTEVDIVVVSTGHPPTHPFSKTSDADWELGLRLMLAPPIALARAFLDRMRSRGYGRLIFIGSVFGLEAEASSVVQSTLRTGLNALCKCLATEAAAEGVTANVVCPGYFDTPLLRALAAQYAKAQGIAVAGVLEEWKNAAPARKFGKPADLGALVALLASPRGEFINGTAMAMDGGLLKGY